MSSMYSSGQSRQMPHVNAKDVKRALIALGAILFILVVGLIIGFWMNSGRVPIPPRIFQPVVAQSGDTLTRIARAHQVSVRAMGVANSYDLGGAFVSTCSPGLRTVGDFCNDRLELAQLSTLRPGQVVKVPMAPPIVFERVRSWGPGRVTVVVDMRSPRSADAAAAYIAAIDALHRTDNVWLFGGSRVQRYETQSLDPSLPVVGGILNAVKVATGSDGASRVFVVSDFDAPEYANRVMPRDTAYRVHCVNSSHCPLLSEGAERAYVDFLN